MSKTEKINVQLLFTPQEFNYLENAAKQQGLTVPLYIKCAVLPNNSFYAYWQQLLQKVAALPAGTKFNIKAIFGTSWTMDKWIKLNLGKAFNSYVDAGTVPNVQVLGKDSSKVMWYEKL